MHSVPNDILIPELARLVAGGQRVMFTPTGVSMRPFIEGGVDSVVLDRAEQVRVGDIVLARYRDLYVLHRVYSTSPTGITSLTSPTSITSPSNPTSYILMGDGNLSGTEQVLKSDILAKVVEIRTPHGRRKPLTRAWLWRHLLPVRWLLLKFYRKSLKLYRTLLP